MFASAFPYFEADAELGVIISERASCGEMEREKEREGMLAMAKWSQLRRGTVTWSRVAALPVL